MEGFVQILIWGFVLFAIGARNAAKKRQERSGGSGPGPVFLPDGTIEPSDGAVLRPTSRPERASGSPIERAVEPPSPVRRAGLPAGRQGGSVRRVGGAPEGPGRSGRTSLRERWTEMARELERELREQAEGTRRPEQAGEMINIPGRRVDATPPATRPSAIWKEGIAEAGEIQDELRRPGVARARPSVRPPSRATAAPRRRSSGVLRLERLDRYGPLERAIILSEILGPPPGLAEDGRGPRRLWDEGPTGRP